MIETILHVGGNILEVTVAVAPWLLIGLIVAAGVRLAIPDARLQQWLGGSGLAPVIRAAVVGAPLPLCSCGAIPTALSLHRAGASRGASTAFLISTPGIGVDSVVLTWVLMGPFMALSRVFGAMATAVATGLAVGRVAGGPAVSTSSEEEGACCSGDVCTGEADDPCGRAASAADGRSAPLEGVRRMGRQILELIDDIGGWLLVGLVLAGVLISFVPPGALATWGSGVTAMLVLALVGIPLYVCATAATPLAAAMLVAGVSPGAVLVFLIAGPVTSLVTLMVLRREMGVATVAVYLASILVGAVAMGLLVDGVAALGDYQPAALAGAAPELWPGWLERTAAGVMLVLIIAPARRAVVRSARWAWLVAWGRSDASRTAPERSGR
ncbi:MAG: SO_0444 family Cu/Zn efflux transporter [Halorhodospira sp.]